MKYFNDCKSLEDVKRLFHKLAAQLHPDNGGNAADFANMYSEYETIFNDIKNGTSSNFSNNTDTESDFDTPENWRDIVMEVIRYTGVNCELIGSWCWLTGNTYPYRENIKNLGFTYSKTKKAWYHTGQPFTHKRRGHYTLDQCRARHGSKTIKGSTAQYID